MRVRVAAVTPSQDFVYDDISSWEIGEDGAVDLKHEDGHFVASFASGYWKQIEQIGDAS